MTKLKILLFTLSFIGTTSAFAQTNIQVRHFQCADQKATRNVFLEIKNEKTLFNGNLVSFYMESKIKGWDTITKITGRIRKKADVDGKTSYLGVSESTNGYRVQISVPMVEQGDSGPLQFASFSKCTKIDKLIPGVNCGFSANVTVYCTQVPQL